MNFKSLLILAILAGSYWTPQALAQENPAVNFTKVPEQALKDAQSKPLNLANRSLGTKLVTLDQAQRAGSEENNSKIAAINADAADELKLEKGNNVYVLELKEKSNINKFSMRSFDAKGSLQLYSAPSPSAERSEWVPLGESQSLTPHKHSVVEFPYEKANVVILNFELTQGGSVSKMDLGGEDIIAQASNILIMSPEELEVLNEKAESLVPHNFASVQNGGSVTHVSSGDPNAALNLIDDDISTPYEFPAVEDSHFLIVDLKDSFKVKKFSMLADAAIGTLQIFKMNQIPPELNDPSSNGNSTNFFETSVPVFEESFTSKNDRISVALNDFSSRYVVVRWVNPPSMDEYTILPLFADSAPVSLRIYEIGFIGEVPEELATLAFVPRAQFLSITQPQIDTPPVPVNPEPPTPESPSEEAPPEDPAVEEAPPTIPVVSP